MEPVLVRKKRLLASFLDTRHEVSVGIPSTVSMHARQYLHELVDLRPKSSREHVAWKAHLSLIAIEGPLRRFCSSEETDVLALFCECEG